MTSLFDRAGRVFWIFCIGALSLFAFFAGIGGFKPGDIVWLTAAMGVLGLAFAFHSILVGRVLRGPRSGQAMRELNALRERRGF